jgi:uncharacterized membrane protein YtjA (UPF0391 family)
MLRLVVTLPTMALIAAIIGVGGIAWVRRHCF